MFTNFQIHAAAPRFSLNNHFATIKFGGSLSHRRYSERAAAHGNLMDGNPRLTLARFIDLFDFNNLHFAGCAVNLLASRFLVSSCFYVILLACFQLFGRCLVLCDRYNLA